jgi:hypothetical protein
VIMSKEMSFLKVAEVTETVDANPYVIRANFNTTGGFPWARLANDMQNQILDQSASRIFAERQFASRLPEPLQPRQGQLLYALMTQTLSIERPRQRIEGHGPEDTLKVTLSTVVRRDWFGFDNTTPQFQDQVCAAMAQTWPPQSWTGVSIIRLVRTLQGGLPGDAANLRHFIELVLPRRNVRVETFALANLTGWTSKHDFALLLTRQLNLRHTIVAGVDEYAV